MPVVEIKMWPGRNNEQKAQIIREITDTFAKIGVPKEHVTVIIEDIPKTNWGMGGEQASK